MWRRMEGIAARNKPEEGLRDWGRRLAPFTADKTQRPRKRSLGTAVFWELVYGDELCKTRIKMVVDHKPMFMRAFP